MHVGFYLWSDFSVIFVIQFGFFALIFSKLNVKM